MDKRYLLVFAGLLLLPAPTPAAAPFAVKEQNMQEPALVKADSLVYDPQTSRVTAEGNVEISQGSRILMAERLVYDQKTNVVYAAGNVSLMEPDGQVYFAQQAQLKDDLKQGIIQSFRVRFSDHSLLAANSARRIDADRMEMRQAVYSPCKICGLSAPLWQIKADRVRLDQKKQDVTYKDAQIDFYGFPVAYSPYLSHPMPGADNKSGFLTPTYSSINTLGATVQIPYYISIRPDMDVTLSPIFTSDEGPVMTGEFRQLTENGKYQLSGSITNPSKRDVFGNPTSGHEVRGHIEGAGRFDLENDWAWGFEGKRTTDDTYLRRYKFGSEDSLTSTAYVQQVKNRDFIGARALTFQGLNAGDDPATTPFVMPLTQTHFETRPGYLGSKLLLDTNTMLLYRSEGPQSRRVSVNGGYMLPIVTPAGHLLELDARVRGDIYSVEDVAVNGRAQDGIESRLIPEVEGKWSYPLEQSFSSGNMVVEPIATVIVSPYGGNSDKIPNEDSQNFELNDLNLFSANKFTGLDRLENGPRANYGVRTAYTTNSNKSLGVLLGQSYRMKANNALYNGSGLEDDVSNYVGRIDVSDNRYFDFAYSFRLDNEDYHFERSEISSNLSVGPFTFGVDYIFLNDQTFSLDGDREEIIGLGGYKINDNWQLTGNARRGLGESEQNGGLISTGLGVLFQNECFGLSTIFNREYTRDRDIEPSTSVIFQISLKNLN